MFRILLWGKDFNQLQEPNKRTVFFFIFKGPVPREVFILNGWSAKTDFAPTILSSHHLLSLIVHCYVYAKGI